MVESALNRADSRPPEVPHKGCPAYSDCGFPRGDVP